MDTITRTVDATPEDVFAVLADGWSYAGWVVGNTHIRNVDPTWPAVGSCIHHSIGAWPLLIEDTTKVLEVEAPHRLVLEARVRPIGVARVTFRVEARGRRTAVTMTEEAVSGPARALDNAVTGGLLHARNAESLNRLFDIAVHRRRAGDHVAAGA
jgi:uncharacterized protein YndB with AHSA1/START domain